MVEHERPKVESQAKYDIMIIQPLLVAVFITALVVGIPFEAIFRM